MRREGGLEGGLEMGKRGVNLYVLYLFVVAGWEARERERERGRFGRDDDDD